MKTNTLIIALSAIFIVMLLTLPLGKGPIAEFFAPARQQISGLLNGMVNFSQWYSDVQKLSSENSKMAEERNQLLGRVAELEAVERENEDLRKQLGSNKKVGQNLIIAKASGLIEKGSAKYLLLTHEPDQNISPGQMVIVDNVLVGVIESVTNSTSLVELPITTGNIIPVKIRYDNQVTKGVIRAGFNLNAQLEQVLPTEKLEVGSTIVTSGEGGTYPPNIVVGKVGQISNRPQDVFQTATIDLLWSPSNLETVFIVT